MKALLPLIRQRRIKGLAHITGGGLTENAPRMCPHHLKPDIDYSSWILPPVFDWLQRAGDIETTEMHRTFNCGVGMVIAVENAEAAGMLEALKAAGEAPFVIGELGPT